MRALTAGAFFGGWKSRHQAGAIRRIPEPDGRPSGARKVG